MIIYKITDKKKALTAVNKDGYALKYVSEALRCDKDVVLAAVKSWGLAFQFASKTLENDRDVVLAAIKQSGCVLFFVSEVFKDDKEVVLAAVKHNGLLLSFASEALKKDSDLIELAVNSNDEKWNEYVLFQFITRSTRRGSGKICVEKINDNSFNGFTTKYVCEKIYAYDDSSFPVEYLSKNGGTKGHNNYRIKDPSELICGGLLALGGAAMFAVLSATVAIGFLEVVVLAVGAGAFAVAGVLAVAGGLIAANQCCQKNHDKNLVSYVASSFSFFWSKNDELNLSNEENSKLLPQS